MSDFRYDRLLEVKEKLLEHKQTELEMAVVSVAAVVSDIEKVDKETGDTYEQITSRCLTGKELSILIGYLSYLDERKASLYDEKKKRETRVSTIRQELLALEMELKILEKLKAKALQAARKVRNRKEQRVMDDLALRIEGK
jgi:flagellar export protein FliJ